MENRAPVFQSSPYNIPNIHFVQTSLAVFLDVDIDGEMGVDISHLVFETFAHSNN